MGRQAGYDRGKVLAQAQALFWSKGFLGTSLKDLETALDMRPGSIYAAFGSKEALFAEALKSYAQHSREAFRQTVAQAGSPLAGLAAHVRALGCVADNRPPSQACMLVKTMLETPPDNADLLGLTETLIQSMEAAFAEMFRQAIQTGELPQTADPDRLASRLQAEIFGLRTYAQRKGSDARVAQMAEDIARDIEALRVAA
ncbi:TetR/AcrR family transcriptional regulator [Thetidibacter halocola]|uniref:TetR/AcrR family transcriptional regulator n=1 Tax=Thetidibacter halocola TaxID=2827239 RepID=A0A8J7WAW3_9RHOB|nr:TetR/AcrR family transcriptional regulator [Thetidibacter halocola]MBS0123357.1 TetR/AcrR family transcriptional regulator [Thetidibacter halocola]